MTFRVKSINFRNLSRRSGRQDTSSLYGVVGDTIKAQIELEYISTFWGGENDIVFTPTPSEINYPTGTNTVGFFYSPDGIFEDFNVGDNLAVFRQSSISPAEFFPIIQKIDNTLVKINVGSSTHFNTRHDFTSNDWVGCAPNINTIRWDYSLDFAFNGFNTQLIGNGRWNAYEDAGGKSYTDGSIGVNRQPYNTFAVNTILRQGNTVNFSTTIEHEFVLYPFSKADETAPNTPQRFDGENCLHYYFQALIGDKNSGVNRTFLSSSDNGNTGGINQTIETGIDKLSVYDLEIRNSANELVTTQLIPDTYTATFKIDYGTLTENADDDAKIWGFVEQEIIDNSKTLRQFWQFDSATRNTGNFLTGATSPNDFSDYILVNNIDVEVISSEVVATVQFKVTQNTPLGNFVMCLNIEPHAQSNTRKNIFIFSLPIVAAPPDLGIRFSTTAISKHNSIGVENTINRSISPNQELLAINRFWVTLPSDVNIQSIRTAFVAQTSGGVLVNTLEQTIIDTSTIPVLDGIFQNLDLTLDKGYPRAETDPFKAIIIRRNPILDTPTERCFEVLTPYIFRYENWQPFAALNGETVSPSVFNNTLPFNGIVQQWKRWGISFDNFIELRVLAANGEIYTINSGLTTNPITFTDYDTGTITVSNSVVNGVILGYANNTVIAEKVATEFDGVPLEELVGIMWANLREQGGVQSTQRISSILAADPRRLWVQNNVAITKPDTDKVRLSATLNGSLIGNGVEGTIWADISIRQTNEFVFNVKTDNTSSGSSTSTQFSLPLVNGGNYDFEVQWGDGNSDTITAWDDTKKTHTYTSAGTYTVKISGICRGWQFNNGGDRLKMLNITRWGCFESGNTIGTFRGCANLNLTNIYDIPNLANTTTFSFFFANCTGLTTIDKINDWDVSTITNMSAMFFTCTSFNQSLNGWNVSNVTTFSSMFDFAQLFNGNISSWNTIGATDMSFMFFSAIAFNQNIGVWDVSNVTTFNSMLTFAVAFNQNIGGWDMASATNINSMLQSCTSFNQDISSWDVSGLTSAINFMTGKSTADFSHLDALYTAWGAQSVNSGVIIAFGAIQYTSAGATGRGQLVSQGWTISDGGLI
jgi:surface protein